MASGGKETRELVKEARSQGWEVTMTKRGHWRFVPPRGRGNLVFSGNTPSDVRSLLNLRSQLRRAGLKLEGGRQ